MIYNLGDECLLANVEAKIAFIDNRGHAYLTPIADGDKYNDQKTFVGLVFAKLNRKGLDANGNKAIFLPNYECGAV